MAANRIIFPGLMPCVDANGDRVPGAKAYFYLDLTTTAASVYTDATLTVPLSNPVVADAVGTWPAMYADTANIFTVAITDAAGLPLPNATWAGVTAALDATLASANLAEAALTATVAAEDEAIQASQLANAAMLQAQAYAAAMSGEVFSPTSASNVAIADGLQVFVLDQTDVLLHEGQTVVVAYEAAPSNQMTGVIQSLVDQTLTVLVSSHAIPNGAGPYASWRISLSAVADNGAVQPTRQVLAAGLASGGGDLSADRTITVPAAVAADIRAGTDATKAVTSAALATSAAFTALTDAATVAWNTITQGFNARVTLGGNRLIGAPTGLQDGLSYVLLIVQDATGSRVPSFDAIWDWGSVGAPTLNTVAGKSDTVVALYNAARGKLEASFRKGA